MSLLIRHLILFLLASLAVASQFLSQLPLLVKSPYLHSWVTAQTINTTGGWPSLWNEHIIGWSAWIRVDGTSYQWTGQTSTSRPNMTANYVTPTRTIFSFQAGPIAFNATYLSPIDPSDLVQQSLPFGYLYVDVLSLDGNTHSVQFYSDMTGEWLSDAITDEVQWNTTQPGNVICHRMHLSSQSSMVERGDIARDSTLFFAMQNIPGMTWQTGNADTQPGLRTTFTSGQPLANTEDTHFRAINDNWPVLAFRVDLGNITKTDSLAWAVGIVREPVVQYTTANGFQTRSSYYWSAYNNGDDIITDVIRKFDDVKSKAIDYDNKVLAAAEAISSNYQDVISLSLRLALASMEFTIPRLPNGTLDTSDVKIFMKDIGSSTRASPVENIYAALPAILYFNASLAGPLLEPLLEYQNSSNYINPYAAADLGVAYPKVLGNSSDTTELAIENCGNMLIMVLAHAMKSGDGSLISGYYGLLKKWADYLEKNTLHPSGYSSADGENIPNLSNLALKGIIGLYAMGGIGQAMGIAEDHSHYEGQAQNYTSQWQNLAISSGHINSVYGDSSSWGLIYNLYADKLLQANLVSNDIYSQQSNYYSSQVGTAPKFGLPYDSNDISKAKSHWTMFTAATVVDTSVRDSLVGMVWQRAIFNDTHAFPDTYGPNKGGPLSGRASPAQGASFAQLALSLSNIAIGVPTPTGSGGGGSKLNVGALAGGIVGGVIGLLLLGLGIFFWRRRRGSRRARESLDMAQANVYEPFALNEVGNDNSAILSSVGVAAIASNSKSRPTIHTYTSSYGASSSVGLSFSPPSTTAGASSTSGANHSSQPSEDLRTEMEQLRREMAQLRTQQLQDTEPPPLYEPGPEQQQESGHDTTSASQPFSPMRRKQ